MERPPEQYSPIPSLEVHDQDLEVICPGGKALNECETIQGMLDSRVENRVRIVGIREALRKKVFVTDTLTYRPRFADRKCEECHRYCMAEVPIEGGKQAGPTEIKFFDPANS